MKTFADYFEIINFATPETNVRLKASDNLPRTSDIIIKRLFNWQDVMHLVVADSLLTRNNIFVKWYVPYKPFARQDRVTDTRHANETEMFKNLIEYLALPRFIFLDVHSDSYKFGKCIPQNVPIKWLGLDPITYHIIVPDAGAAKKINAHSGGITFCSKTRDPITGKLSGFNVPPVATRPHTEKLILIDDICDGGGTFIGIAEKLQEYREKHKLVLYVTHGIFSKGFDDLLKYYDEIITTNSYRDYSEGSAWLHLGNRLKTIDVLSDEFMEFAIK